MKRGGPGASAWVSPWRAQVLLTACLALAFGVPYGLAKAVGAHRDRAWAKSGLSAHEVGEWRHYGFGSAEEAVDWRKARFQPPGALLWKKEGFGPAEAAAWKELDFGPGESRGWRREGFSAPDAAPWREEGFLPVDAALWRRSGVTAAAAAARRKAGKTPR